MSASENAGREVRYERGALRLVDPRGGALREVGTSQDGERDGVWETYEGEVLVGRRTDGAGVLNGDWFRVYGGERRHGTYLDGERHGSWTVSEGPQRFVRVPGEPGW